jgi:hypothetical protein
MRRGKQRQALTEYRLCTEFKCLPSELAKEPAKKIQEFLVILGEIDKQTQEEMDKAKRQTGSVRGFT